MGALLELLWACLQVLELASSWRQWVGIAVGVLLGVGVYWLGAPDWAGWVVGIVSCLVVVVWLLKSDEGG